MDQADVQEANNQFVHVAFNGETHQPLNKDQRGRGRQGKLTQAGRAALKAVKRAGGQCERCRILKKKCDGNEPCNQCKGVKRKPNSRWIGKPCKRQQANPYLEQPLRDPSSLRNTEQTLLSADLQNSSTRSVVLSGQVPSLPLIQAMGNPHVRSSYRSKTGHISTSFLGSCSELIRTALVPLPKGMLLSWTNARPYVQTEVSLQLQRTTPARDWWTFTVHSNRLGPLLQSLLQQSALRELLVASERTISASQIPNSTYFKLLIFLVANNFPGLDGEGEEAILQPLWKRSCEEIGAFFRSIVDPTKKALANNIFYHAIKAGEERIVESLLMDQSLGIDVNKKKPKISGQDSGLTPLDLCYKYRQPAVAKVLLRCHARVTEMVEHGEKILELGIDRSCSNVELTRQLLDAGAHIDTMILDDLLSSEEFEIFEMLIRYLPCQDRELWYWRAFFLRYIWAADHETCSKTVELMIASQVDLDRRVRVSGLDDKEVAIIDIAAHKGYLGLVGLLLRSGARLTPHTIPFASQNEHWELVEYFLNHGPDTHVAAVGSGALASAIRANNTQLIRLLIRYGAFRQIKKTDDLNLVIHAASASGNIEIIRTLLAVAEEMPKSHDTDFRTSSNTDWLGLGSVIKAGQTDIALLIIRNFTIFSCFYLHLAILHRNLPIVRALLDADIFDLQSRNLGILQRAVSWGDHSLIKELLSKGVNVNEPSNWDHESPLLTAVTMKSMILVKTLLDAGAFINETRYEDCSKSRRGYTCDHSYCHHDSPALTLATRLEDVKMVHFLLQRGADSHNSMALYEAIKTSNYGLVHILLEAFTQQYPLGERGYGTNAFMVALDMDDMFWMEFLIDKVDVTALYPLMEDLEFCSDCYTPLGYAIWRSKDSGSNDTYVRGARFLLEHGVDPQASVFASSVTKTELTSLRYAVTRRSIPMINLLLEFKADINYLGATKSRTPLQYAAESGDLEIVKLLLENGAAINDRPAGVADRTALQLAAIEGHTDIVSLLLKSGADINAPHSPDLGATALQLAVIEGHIDIVSLLLKSGADINAPPFSDHEETALQLAVIEGHIDIVSLLLKSGADINAPPSPDHGATALQFAAIKGYIGIALLLLEHGADINAPPSSIGGRTALEGAAEWGRLDMVKFLLDEGIDVKSEVGYRYLRAAKKRAYKNGHNAIVDLLESYCPDRPYVQAVFTDRDGWTFWAVETEHGFEAWEGEIPTMQDQRLSPGGPPRASDFVVSDPIDGWLTKPRCFETGFYTTPRPNRRDQRGSER